MRRKTLLKIMDLTHQEEDEMKKKGWEEEIKVKKEEEEVKLPPLYLRIPLQGQ
jgi:hypothetical protein